MTYASLDDLIARAGEREILDVADRDGDGLPDGDVVAEALTHADNIVNGYVATAYTLPFAAVPDLVRTWAVAIARHKLHHQGPPDYVVAEYKDALASLRDVQAGRMTLPIATGEIPQASSGTPMFADAPTKTATQIMKGWCS